MIVTLDGPAGSGKSAAALLLARRLKIPHLDTGAMYRAAALSLLLSPACNLNSPAEVADHAKNLALSFDWSQDPPPILLNGHDVSQAIRTPEVTAKVYLAADNPQVREDQVSRQRRIAQQLGSLVTEGRDQGTVVFPSANFKFYLDGAPEVRARRRVDQLAFRGIRADMHEVLMQIKQRDQRDATRAVGPLLKAPDAITIDTTRLNLEQVVDAMLKVIGQNAPARSNP